MWQSLGRSDHALWGECRGSALYQVRADLGNLGTKCSCPSRKFPCKHALGLLLLAATEPGRVSPAAPPEWVADWLGKRVARAERKEAAGAEESKPDPVAQAKRQEQRLDRIGKGLDGLDLWMNDVVRHGLAGLSAEPASFWEAQAARLVDAQAPALASRLRRLGTIPGSSEDWPRRLLDELGRIALLTHAFRRLDALAPPLQADVRQLVGLTLTQEEVTAAGQTLTDDWIVLGQLVDDDERLRAQRSWLRGRRSGRFALVLQFAPGTAPFAENIVPGTAFEAELVYWPSASPQRALIRTRLSPPRAWEAPMPGHATIDDFLAAVAAQVASQPWLDRTGAALCGVTPIPGETWHVRDARGSALRLTAGSHWHLLALSGGAPVDVAGEWDGERLLPLGLVTGGAYHMLWRPADG
jgi:hypothetical protein